MAMAGGVGRHGLQTLAVEEQHLHEVDEQTLVEQRQVRVGGRYAALQQRVRKVREHLRNVHVTVTSTSVDAAPPSPAASPESSAGTLKCARRQTRVVLFRDETIRELIRSVLEEPFHGFPQIPTSPALLLDDASSRCAVDVFSSKKSAGDVGICGNP
eukprot:836597-Prorocentrum_minimum.AAC.1